LSATTYSKSVLRVAADEVVRANPRVSYFPAFEIITGSFNRGSYYADDLRTVTDEGIEHVMRSFFKNCTATFVKRPTEAEAAALFEIVCEEELINAAR